MNSTRPVLLRSSQIQSVLPSNKATQEKAKKEALPHIQGLPEEFSVASTGGISLKGQLPLDINGIVVNVKKEELKEDDLADLELQLDAEDQDALCGGC